MDLARLRNLGVVAHIDAGKTTVSERLLFFSGVEHKLGEVDDGTATMDWMPEERERGISITAAATTLPWRDHVINLIDTPGHVDFTIEVERSLRVLDGAILVIDAVAGVQAQTETVWRQMRRHRVPAIAFVNKCDRAGADFLAAVASLKRRLAAPAVPIQYPYFLDGRLCGVIDLVRRRLITFPVEPHDPPSEAEVPGELASEVGVLRSELVDALAESDDALMTLVLENRDAPAESVARALRARTLESSLMPVLCGSALCNIGVQPLLDAVLAYLPSPGDLPPVRGRHPERDETIERPASDREPSCALAFKLHADAHGDLTFLRIYSGTLAGGMALWNPRTKKHERVGRLLRMHADHRASLESAGAGDIVAVTGLKHTATGDTLCAHAAPIVLETLVIPEPVIEMVVEPRSSADREKLREALARMAHEDPTFRQREDETTGQWHVSGMGELHLEVVLHRVRSEFKVEASMGQPRVAYRESVRSASRGSARVERSLGGKDVFGAVELELEPAPASSGVEVAFDPDCRVPQPFRSAVLSAVELEGQVGPRLGYPLVGARVRLCRGESQPRLDAEVAFVQAASLALRHAMAQAEVQIHEPVMSFAVESPAEYSSGVLADLAARGAQVNGVTSQGNSRLIVGQVPLLGMFGYSTVVRSLSQGRAGYSMQPAGFAPVSENELIQRGLV